MVDLDNDKDKIIKQGQELWNSIIKSIELFNSKKRVANFLNYKRIIRYSRSNLNKLQHQFQDYLQKVNEYISDVALARHLIVGGQQKNWTPADRNKAHIFSEQLLNQQKIISSSLQNFNQEINNFEQQYNNKRLIWATYAMLGVSILLFVVSLIELSKFFI